MITVAALAHAASQVGVREQPPKSNRGPEVDEYLRSVGLDPTRGVYPWCAAFVHWCFEKAAADVGAPNPVPRTASAMRLPERAAWARVDAPAPGCVFVIDHGGGKGHCGFVESVAPDGLSLVTVEGNTDPHGGREGDGVYRRSRKMAEVFAFLDFSRPHRIVDVGARSLGVLREPTAIDAHDLAIVDDDARTFERVAHGRQVVQQVAVRSLAVDDRPHRHRIGERGTAPLCRELQRRRLFPRARRFRLSDERPPCARAHDAQAVLLRAGRSDRHQRQAHETSPRQPYAKPRKASRMRRHRERWPYIARSSARLSRRMGHPRACPHVSLIRFAAALIS